MSATPEIRNLRPPELDGPALSCPEDVDWILDIDSLETAGGEAFRNYHQLERPPTDSPHFPFGLTAESASLWNRTVRQLSMAAGEVNIILTATANKGQTGPVFYCRVAGYREQGLPRIAAVFQKLDQNMLQSSQESTWKNWLYLLHEIKNTVSLLKAAEDEDFSTGSDSTANPAGLRQFAIDCLENHIRNGVFLAAEGSADLPNNPAALDLKPFFNSIADAYRDILAQRGVRLLLDLDCESLGRVRMDRTLLEQLLNNILLNKHKYLHNTDLVLRVQSGCTRSTGEGFHLAITLEDKGPPFPQAVLDNQAAEFRIQGLLNLDVSSGLGLSICQRIVRSLNGKLSLHNAPDCQRILIQLPVT